MAPLTTRSSGRLAAGFAPVNTAQGPPANEVIQIEDDDDEEEGNVNDEEETEEDEDEDMDIGDNEDGDEGEEDEEEYEDEEEEEEEEDEDENQDDAEEANGVKTALNGFARGNTETSTPELFTSAGAQQALHPLRRTADRVTRQIEAFAEKLDRFKQKDARETDEFGRLQAAFNLVKSYHNFTATAVDDISKQNTLKRAKAGWGATRGNDAEAEDPKTVEELQRLQLEANTWQLLLNLISISHPAGRKVDQEAQQTAFQKLHRYSSDREVWEQFLDADYYARECVVVMKWLENTFVPRDIDALIDDLEGQAERGQGLWAHGWLFTKEEIKGQKRLRAWPQPLEPNDPGLAMSLLTSDKSGALITQLDPDAITRQKHSLQKQDQFHERATWMTCWKMLRRGENWTKIREWAQERLEHWRAVSLCGASVDTASHVGKTPVDDGTTRMMNFRSRGAWQNACSALAHNPSSEDFERAVYAMLCGETEAAFAVCQNYDDYLYVYFNSIVLGRYEKFCKELQRKMAHSPTTPVTFVPDPARYDEAGKFLESMRSSGRVGAEARNPYRTIQAVILSRGYDSFFYKLAPTVSSTSAAKSDGPTIIPDLSTMPSDESLVITAEDEDALRIAAHLYLVATFIGYVRTDTQFFEVASVNVIGYIASLEQAGLFSVIPLYASLLPTHLAHSILGQIMIGIVDPAERQQQARLMEKHGIDIEAVLEDQWQWIASSVSPVEHSASVTQSPKVSRRPDGTPYLVRVRTDLVGTFITSDDEYMIRSLEWLRYVDGQWGKICQLGALLYRRFYIAGKLAAARELSRRMNLADISQEAFGYNVLEFGMGLGEGLDAPTPEPMSPSKSRVFGSGHKRTRSNGMPAGEESVVFVQQAETMHDFEVLILAFDALEDFALTWEKLDKNRRRRDSGTTKNLLVALEEALDEVGMHVDSLLGEWLLATDNDPNPDELEQIRQMYIPEVFLYFHNALYYGAHALSADHLVQCMNLGIQVSENEHLTRSFIGSRRMREMVDALAVSSKAMVNARAEPGRKLKGGEVLGIWSVVVEDDEEEDIHGAA